MTDTLLDPNSDNEKRVTKTVLSIKAIEIINKYEKPISLKLISEKLCDVTEVYDDKNFYFRVRRVCDDLAEMGTIKRIKKGKTISYEKIEQK